MSAELLPCPFCGDEGEKGRQTVTMMTGDRPKFDRIICRCCGAMCPEHNWNERAALAPQAPAAQPLTDDQIDAMLLALMHVTGREALTIAGRVTWDDATRHRLRSIVRAHGIGIAPPAQKEPKP